MLNGWSLVEEKAVDEQEYAWAGQLVNYLYQLTPDDQQVRRLKADISQ